MVAYRETEIDSRVKRVSPTTMAHPEPNKKALQESPVAVAVTASWFTIAILYFFQKNKTLSSDWGHGCPDYTSQFGMAT